LSPNRLDIEITNRCKYRCGICSIRATNVSEPNEISMGSICEKIREFWAMGGKEISITGGEPAERGLDFLCSIFSFCRNLGLSTRMYTVGYGFQDYWNVYSLATAGLNSAYISLEGSKKVDDEYKGVKGAYEIAVRAIELFMRAGIDVVIHYTPTKINFMDFFHVVRMAKKYSIERIRIMSYVKQGRGWNNKDKYSMDRDDQLVFKNLLEKAVKGFPEIKFQFSGQFNNLLGIANDTTIKKNRMAMTYDGYLIPSLALRMFEETNSPDPEFVLGRTTESLEAAWKSYVNVKEPAHTDCQIPVKQ
jgi:MoaA/NifB/PqqE/SkfB family radical SAM enzyme